VSDYIKRLEKAVQKPAGPGGIIRIKKADLRSLLADVERMERALVFAIERFEEYAALHAAKPDMEKAKRNSDMAELLRQALSAPNTEEGE